MRNCDMRRDFDREVEEALARYVAVEPREGLEQRVMANLRARAAGHGRLGWRPLTTAALAFTAVVVTLAICIGRGPARTNVSRGAGEHKLAGAGDSVFAVGSGVTKMQGYSGDAPATGNKRHLHRRERERAAVGAAPKLAEFPAPEPLTREEKLLIAFVERDPRDAALFTELSAKDLQRDADDMSLPVDETDSQQIDKN